MKHCTLGKSITLEKSFFNLIWLLNLKQHKHRPDSPPLLLRAYVLKIRNNDVMTSLQSDSGWWKQNWGQKGEPVWNQKSPNTELELVWWERGIGAISTIGLQKQRWTKPCPRCPQVSVYLQNWSHVLSYVNKAESTPEIAEVSPHTAHSGTVFNVKLTQTFILRNPKFLTVMWPVFICLCFF